MVQRARQLAVEMPICAAVNELLEGRLDALQAVAALMARESRDEIGPGGLPQATL